MRNLIVAVPPFPEQPAIAPILSDADTLLGALDWLDRKEARFQTGHHDK